MSLRMFYLMGFVVAVLGQDIPPDFNFRGAAQSISVELRSLTFVPYSRPAQKVEEFIAAGDSYTAGTGCNDLDEIIAGDALRGKRSYPMQMSTDKDNWGFINGDETLPRFSFPAYTGDTTVELVSKQLIQGDYKDNNRNLPRGQPFGKPQIAVVTIGGNDAERSNILNDCIYQGWRPKDCQATLSALQKEIDDGILRDKYAPINTPSEGPGDINNPYPADDLDPAQLLLDFIFPGDNRKVAEVSEMSPPWEWEGAEKFPTFNGLLLAISNAEDINATAVPFNLKRSFHPKATAFAEHKTLIFAAIVNNRDAATSDNNGANYTERCKDVTSPLSFDIRHSADR
ncbi:hypothetical protein DL766_006074 [Monosporascus sp. MC13-8B]|uniref:SGNH hydrolase-type esterase domain-containing protein n=1 Tax=Monosporascus cannonballus TaxID=155416 RepID=A0ABY0H0M5_9PEZI|nr:hypothetical protein DL762_006957 [Monosporascus cannonballus]RYO85891.1 hypothetical protein DL763_006922 [Monosporascus cannonballus]RYP28081.1 hypothetical protein DL766_006074 [Monosporascus sp. MC13-8B]